MLLLWLILFSLLLYIYLVFVVIDDVIVVVVVIVFDYVLNVGCFFDFDKFLLSLLLVLLW
jgi:hypothetical protein